MEIECNVYVGKTDENKTIYIRKIKMAANDPRVKKYTDEYQKVFQFAIQNGYKIKDVAQLKEEEVAYLLELVKTPQEEDKSNSMGRK